MTDATPQPSPLTDREVCLLRQVHPTLVTSSGEIMKAAFTPSARDAGMLSTLHGRIGAVEAYRRWTGDRGFESAGTYGVEVGEVHDLGLAAVDDSGVVEPDHVSIDFRNVPSKGRIVQLGRKLRDAATTRGCLHPAGADGTAA